MLNDDVSQELSVLLKDISEGDIDFARYLLQSFHHNAQDAVLSLKEQQNDLGILVGNDVAKQLHKLIGSSGLMGLTSLMYFLREKESYAVQQELIQYSWLSDVQENLSKMLSNYNHALDVQPPS